jgi:hypothetical protein
LVTPAPRPTLRGDESAYSPGAAIGTVIGVIITVVFALLMLPTLTSTVTTAAADPNLTATQASLLNLVPTFYVIGVVLLAIAIVFYVLHQGMDG